jgi:hypothetical protein
MYSTHRKASFFNIKNLFPVSITAITHIFLIFLDHSHIPEYGVLSCTKDHAYLYNETNIVQKKKIEFITSISEGKSYKEIILPLLCNISIHTE